jgi:uncharacterized protein YjbI with pentapeptide repeats
MPNPEHLEILRKGVDAWNEWRETHFDVRPDLGEAALSEANLSEANLSGSNLCGADLQKANFDNANLSGAKLSLAKLSGANFNEARLRGADLRGTNLSEAYLSEANLNAVDLSAADLSGAYLSEADLREANFSRADLSGADFTDAEIGYTVFTATNLSQAKGLDAVQHIGPSSIGIDTFFESRGKIPEAFLRGCGVPDIFITFAASLASKPVDYYSCFISYSSKDQEFAQRLHADLQASGVRCWFAPEDLKIGDKFRVTIDETIRVYDKLLLVLSEHSVASDWVEKEVETAFEKERQQKRTMLFPIRLDNAVMNIPTGWPADIRRTRHIGDFHAWRTHDAYQTAFARLLRDLKSTEPNPK